MKALLWRICMVTGWPGWSLWWHGLTGAHLTFHAETVDGRRLVGCTCGYGVREWWPARNRGKV